MSLLTIRAAVDADLEAICAIYNESIPRRLATADLEPQSIDARRAWFVNRDHATRPVLVAEDGLGVCAWGSYTNFKDRSAYAPTAEVSVYVADRATGRGIGRAMLDALIERAPACGIDRILGFSFAHNELEAVPVARVCALGRDSRCLRDGWGAAERHHPRPPTLTIRRCLAPTWHQPRRCQVNQVGARHRRQ